jgi:hypothetical protein
MESLPHKPNHSRFSPFFSILFHIDQYSSLMSHIGTYMLPICYFWHVGIRHITRFVLFRVYSTSAVRIVKVWHLPHIHHSVIYSVYFASCYLVVVVQLMGDMLARADVLGSVKSQQWCGPITFPAACFIRQCGAFPPHFPLFNIKIFRICHVFIPW